MALPQHIQYIDSKVEIIKKILKINNKYKLDKLFKKSNNELKKILNILEKREMKK